MYDTHLQVLSRQMTDSSAKYDENPYAYIQSTGNEVLDSLNRSSTKNTKGRQIDTWYTSG